MKDVFDDVDVKEEVEEGIDEDWNVRDDDDDDINEDVAFIVDLIVFANCHSLNQR